MHNPYNPPSAKIEKLDHEKEDNKMKRPTFLSVIAWILITMSGLSLITITLSLNMSLNDPMMRELLSKSPIPIPLQIAITYVGILITIVSGVAILKGQNWARFLYVGWSVIGFVIGLLTNPMKVAMIPGLVIFVVIAFFLFRPKANEYFSTKETASSAKGV